MNYKKTFDFTDVKGFNYDRKNGRPFDYFFMAQSMLFGNIFVSNIRYVILKPDSALVDHWFRQSDKSC